MVKQQTINIPDYQLVMTESQQRNEPPLCLQHVHIMLWPIKYITFLDHIYLTNIYYLVKTSH